MAPALELLQVVDHTAAEEGAAVLDGRLVDDDFGAFGLDALHHALDGGLPPVYKLHFLRNDVHRGDMVVLAQQRRDAQAHVAGAGDGDIDVSFVVHCL